MEAETPTATSPEAGFYARLVIAHPCKILNATLFTCLAFIALGFAIPEKGLNFSEVKKGFEPRGTEFAVKLNAYRQLQVYPEHRPCGDCKEGDRVAKRGHLKPMKPPIAKVARRLHGGSAIYPAYPLPPSNNLNSSWLIDHDTQGVIFNGSVAERAYQHEYCQNHYRWSEGAQNFAAIMRSFASCYGDGTLWCKNGAFQKREYPFAVSLAHPTSEDGDMSNVGKLVDICEFSRRLKGSKAYSKFGRRLDGNTCPVVSLTDALLILDVYRRVAQEGAMSEALESEFVSIAWGRVPCISLTQEKLDLLLGPSGLLRKCGTALFGGACKRGGTRPMVAHGNLLCDGGDVSGDATLQTTCTQEVNQLVNYIFTYLVDKEWLNPDLAAGGYSTTLRNTNIFLPLLDSEASWELYEPFREEFGDYFGSKEAVKVAGVKVAAKGTLFSNQLSLDARWVGLATVISIAALIFHTRMVTLSIVCAAQITCSFWVAYFVFRCIYGMGFFSFLNMNMLFIAIAIGVDDIFVFMDAYRQSYLSLPRDCGPASRLQWTMNRAFSAMLITTLTTSVAFLGNLVSPITTIKLFSIFGATVIFVDFLLMMTVLPCLMVFSEYTERFRSTCNFWCNQSPALRASQDMNMQKRLLERVYVDYLAPVVTHKYMKWVIFVTFTAYGIICLTQALQLKPSDAENLQLFVPWHPTEKYDQVLLNEFRFEAEARSSEGLPVIFFAGVEPSDEGSTFEPMDLGEIKFSPGSLNSPEAQVYFRDLCDSFASGPLFAERHVCPYQKIEAFVRRPCNETEQDPDNASNCCDLSYPLPEGKVPDCIRAMFTWNGQRLHTHRFMDWEGIMLDGNHYLKVVMMSYQSTLQYSSVVDHLQGFYDHVNSWAVAKCKEAPAGAAKPFWFSNLNFWDLMTGMQRGAYQSAGVSLVCCGMMLLIVGGNVVMALYATISIIWVLMCLVATLMFFGWKMDLMVAIVLSISVGMSVDFVCHMAHAYVHADHVNERADERGSCSLVAQLPWKSVEERTERVRYVMMTMGISVTMCAITTFGGGLAMLPAQVNFFFQFGTFLCVAMFNAFIFAVFHFTSGAAVLGTVGRFGNLFPIYRQMMGLLPCCGPTL